MAAVRSLFGYLATSTRSSLESFELKQLNASSNTRKTLLPILRQHLEEQAMARLARWAIEIRHISPRRPVWQHSVPMHAAELPQRSFPGDGCFIQASLEPSRWEPAPLLAALARSWSLLPPAQHCPPGLFKRQSLLPTSEAEVDSPYAPTPQA